jgi:alkylation response protein AidB-like acyl-CoA dehydrogenase
MGLGVFEYCLVSEELARAWLSVGSILARGQGLGTQVLDDRRRADLLARSAKGDWIGAIALSEPTAGSDLAGVQTRAVRDGDGWVLTGHKRWAGNALAADFVEVLARTREPREGEARSAGLEPFLVVKERGAFPDGMTGHAIDKIGYHGFLTWDLELDGVRVPDSDRLTGLYGDEGSEQDEGGFSSVQRGLNIARVHTAARAVGVARGAVEDTAAYLQEREQFGRPIAQFQALRFALADMAAQVEQARAFTRQVAHWLDEGVPCEREAAMVKLLATEMAVQVTGQAMQLHGGNGYTTERRVERYWRDARLTTIFEGTSEIQRRIISDRLLPARAPVT